MPSIQNVHSTAVVTTLYFNHAKVGKKNHTLQYQQTQVPNTWNITPDTLKQTHCIQTSNIAHHNIR